MLGAPFDGTSGGRPRQADAPGLLRAAVGLHGPDGSADARPVWDAGDVLVDPVEPELTLERIQAAFERVRSRGRGALPVVLGGEHTVSLAAVEALEPASIVSVDAHPDLWDAQHGREIAQGTWLRRAIERTDAQVVLPYARAARGGEEDAIEELDVGTQVPDELPEPVYLTVDVDVFDPQEAPAVVWPEPGGPSVDEVLALVGDLASTHELAGLDVVEVNASGRGPTVDLAARVLDRAIGAADR